MDFPLFHLDFLGNRMMVAVIAIIHVLINHALAVGFLPLVTLLEYRGYNARRFEKKHAEHWDKFAYKLLFVAFIITTSLGALTGVGIWFATSLANPASIGSLIRVFYGAWFAEWIVFVLEVVFILIYFLTWKKSNESIIMKRNHLLFGGFLSIFSWLTMAIIVGILGFMMDPGNWFNNESMIVGFTNPVYLPQLMFRTPLAMIMGGLSAMFMSYFFLKKDNPIFKKALKIISLWVLIWTPYAFIGAYLYYVEIPDFMIGNLPVAVTTQNFQQWYDSLIKGILVTVGLALIIGFSGLFMSRRIPRWLLILPLIVVFFFVGMFERIREFVRKPYVIGEYMYANALLEEDYPLYKQDGILKHATYVKYNTVTEENKTDAGKEVFIIACTRCHTTHGVNSVVTRFENMYGVDNPFNVEAMKTYMSSMHNVRAFMPPFPGNEMELDALAHYIKSLQEYNVPIEGVQIRGTEVSNKNPWKMIEEMGNSVDTTSNN